MTVYCGQADGSDAIHPDPDYSAVYVTLTTDRGDQESGAATSLPRRTLHCVNNKGRAEYVLAFLEM